jgi:hypothetical protein
MATKDKVKSVEDLKPPEHPGPDATEDQVREFNEQRLEYEEQRAQLQKEAAEKSPQVQNAP